MGSVPGNPEPSDGFRSRESEHSDGFRVPENGTHLRVRVLENPELTSTLSEKRILSCLNILICSKKLKRQIFKCVPFLGNGTLRNENADTPSSWTLLLSQSIFQYNGF